MSKKKNIHPIHGRRLLVPRMSTVGAECLAASLRSLEIDAVVSPRSDHRTLELAARYTTGDECLPQRIVLGNFLKVILDPAFDPSQYAFFMPTSSGPCRFGQYAPLLKKILQELKYDESMVFSPTSSDQYESIGANVNRFTRIAWRAIVVSDVLRKLTLMYRPYELEQGVVDGAIAKFLSEVCDVLSHTSIHLGKQIKELQGLMETIRDRLQKITLKEPLRSRPLLGAVGEIFLRLNSYSNQNIIRRIEASGGECWMADISEWVWYTNSERARKLKDRKRALSFDMLKVKIRDHIQRSDEHRIMAPLQEIFVDRPEAVTKEILHNSHPYLPARKALGEMTINAGKAVSYYRAGCDGIVDISPFACMNGIVTEAVYPAISKDYDDIPIRIFYFDGVPVDLDRDLEIFMELVRSYRRKRLDRGVVGEIQKKSEIDK